MNKNNMQDFITPKKRLKTFSISRLNWIDIIAIIIIIFAIGSVQSWL